MKKETKQALELIRTIENMSKCLNQIKDEYDKKEWTEDEFNELFEKQMRGLVVEERAQIVAIIVFVVVEQTDGL